MTTGGELFTRGMQIAFALAVLGLSAHLVTVIKGLKDDCELYYSDYYYCDDYLGRLPAASEYATFTGVFGTVGATVGLVALFKTAVPWGVVMGVDVLTTIFYLAGGINSALFHEDDDCLEEFCQIWTASVAFMFIGFVVSLLVAVAVAKGRPAHPDTNLASIPTV